MKKIIILKFIPFKSFNNKELIISFIIKRTIIRKYYMEYNYLTDEQINRLKIELMSKTTGLKSLSDIIFDAIRTDKNNDKGKHFGNNIRLSLKNYYNWKISSIPRNFFYRKIIYKNKDYIICPSLNIEAEKFFINFDEEDHSCFVIEKDTNTKIFETSEISNIKMKIFDKTFIVESPKEIETDGIFNINQFDIKDFDPNEITIIFNNIENKDFKCCVIEVKYNKNKIDELIAQLNRDKEVLKKIIDKDILYLGFVNLKENEKAYVDINTVGNLECLVLGINNEVFCGNNIAYPINWKQINDYLIILKQFETVQKQFKTIQEKLDLLIKKQKNNEFLSKKRIKNDEEDSDEIDKKEDEKGEAFLDIDENKNDEE